MQQSSCRIVFNTKCTIWIVIVILIVVSNTLALYYGQQPNHSQQDQAVHASVVSNGIGCAKVGTDIFKKGGCHVDAIIATALCESVMLPQSMGPGGGFVATLYTNGKVETLVARETAPAAAHRDMFVNQTAVKGILAAGVPAEILGYWELHKKYGCMKWNVLFEPAIKLCEGGHVVSKYLAGALLQRENDIIADPGLSAIFRPNGVLVKEGDFIKHEKLGSTYRRIARYGVNEIYGGGLTGKKLVEDIQAMGGIITEADLRNYRVRWEKSTSWGSIKGKYKVHTTPLPSSGPVLAFMLNVMDDFFTENNCSYYQRVTETFKHAYGQRSNLGDLKGEIEMHESIKNTFENLTSVKFAEFIRTLIFDDRTFTDTKYYGANFTIEPEHGTANLAAIDSCGNAIVMTSTVNNYFGCKKYSQQTGIILNDEMDDFSTPGLINSFGVPASPANFIVPGKMPLSSMCPTIILDDNGKVVMLAGAAGGTKITSSVALAIIKYMMLDMPLENSINDGRIHHQLVPMHVDFDPELPESLQTCLKNIGHQLQVLPPGTGFAAVTSIGMRDDVPEPVYDRRRVGSISTVQRISYNNMYQGSYHIWKDV